MAKAALVTGGNQGLGLALIRGLCRQLSTDDTVYLAARDEGRGRQALDVLGREDLRAELLLMDMTDPASIAAAGNAIVARHDGIDIVIGNAAARIVRERTPAEQVRLFVDTNNHGTRRLIDVFGPLLKDRGRFIVIASSFGSLRRLDPALHSLFDAPGLTLDDLDRAMSDYVVAVEQGRAASQGWPEWINVASKVGQVASMRIFARQIHDEGRRRDILVNAACPGLVDTEASRPWFEDMSQAQSPDVAAQDVLWLATLPAGETAPYGELVRQRKVVAWR